MGKARLDRSRFFIDIRCNDKNIMMKKIRYGIIGFGNFAERAIMPAIRNSKNSELVAIQKRSFDEAKHKADQYCIPLYFDSAQSLVNSNEVDAVFIVSANSQHHDDTITAARAGKHVIVEKPMAVTYSQAFHMVAECNAAHVKFMVGHMLRFSPLLRRMKEIIESKILGDITFARAEFIYNGQNSKRQWLWNKRIAGGGPLFDIGIHCLDSLRFILNDEVADVKSLMRGDNGDHVEKTNVLALRFKKGQLGTIYSSFETGYRQTSIEFQGTLGSVSASKFTPSKTSSIIETRFNTDGMIGDILKEEIIVPDLYELEVSHFSDCILHDQQPMVSAESSLHNQFILEQAILQK